MRRNFWRGIVPLATLLVAGGMVACDDDGGGTAPPPPTPLSAEAKSALDEALQDAYRTYYTYAAVVADLGAVAPFTTITSTEQSYTTTLTALYAAHDATPPAPQWNTGNVPRYQQLEQACMAAEDGEVATEMMFERLLRLNVPDDVHQAFTSLRLTAREQHRVAFRSCVGGAIVPATDAVRASMAEALQAEYALYFTYRRAAADLGSVAPFTNVGDAEWLHVGAVSNLFVKRSLVAPASTWTLDNVPRFATKAAACAAAADAELDLAMTYDRLLLQSLPVDVERVFENVREASLENHLAVFQQCAGGGTAPVGADVLAAMDEAIRDEYRAYFTYAAVVEDLEPDFPFGPIRDAEESHYTALANLYTKRSLAVPPSPWSLANVPRFGTRTSACADAVTQETANVAMYDRLLALTLPDDVEHVFTNLRAASRDHHLPAFQSCD